MCKLRSIIALLLALPIMANAQSLDDYLQEAANHNPILKASYAAFEMAVQQVAVSKALPDPALSFGYFISPVETRVGPQIAKFSLTQMFPWFGTLGAQKSMSAKLAEAKYAAFLDARNELFYQVKSAYYPLYELRQQLDLQKENLQILELYKTLAESNFANGRSTMVDVIRIDMMKGDAQTEIALLEAKAQPLEAQLRRWLNRRDESPLEVAEELPTILLENSYRKDSMLLLNPQMQALNIKLEAALAFEQVAKKQGLPKMGVGLDYMIVGERNDMAFPDNGKDAIMPMATISLPVFRGKYRAAVEQARLSQMQLSAQKAALGNQLLSAYDMAWFEFEKAKQLMDLYDQQIQKTELARDLLYKDYGNAGKAFEEVLRLQQQLIKYQTSRITAIKDAYLALALLDYLTAKSEIDENN